MKVLFVNPAKTAYGSGQSMLAFLEHVHFEAEVACSPGGPLEVELRRRGIKCHGLEFSKYSFRKRPDWLFSFYRRFCRILTDSRPDIMVINLDGNTPLVTLAASQKRIPIVRFCRFEFIPPKRWVDQYCWRKADAVICPSELVRQQLLTWAPPDFKSRVHRWYEPHIRRTVLPVEIRRIRDQLGLDRAKTLVYVGRIHAQKRIETVIRALREVRTKFPDTRLLLVGAHDGSAPGIHYENDLSVLARELALQDAVQFLGYRDRHEVTAITAASDICLLPSETESFGMVLTEAWAVRVPTVASDVGGCREITLASGGGMLCPVGDSSSFALQILRLLSEPQLARKCALAGEAWVKENCDSHSYSERFHTLLQDLANQSSSGSTSAISLAKKERIRDRANESHPAEVKSN